MRRILVTGASGFIGKALTKTLLENKFDVIGVVRAKDRLEELLGNHNLSAVECDLANYSKLPDMIDGKIDAAIHLAWEGPWGPLRDNYSVQLNNIKGTLDCISAANRLGCKRFLAAGSITENFVTGCPYAVGENMLYGGAKLSAYNMGRILCNKIGMKYIWCQLTGIYGPGEKATTVINYSIKCFKEGKKPTYTKAETQTDFLFIDDCVNAIRLLLEVQEPRGFYFIGSGNPQPLKEYLLEIRDSFDEKLPIGIGERTDDVVEHRGEWFDIDALVKDTGFRAEVSFPEGIRRILGHC